MIERIDRALYGLVGLAVLFTSGALLAAVNGWAGVPDPDALLTTSTQALDELPVWWRSAATSTAGVLVAAGLFLVWRQIPRPVRRRTGALNIPSGRGATALTPSAAAHLVEHAFGQHPDVIAVDGRVLDPGDAPRFAVRCDLRTGASVQEFRQHRGAAETNLATILDRPAVTTRVRLRLDREPEPRVV